MKNFLAVAALVGVAAVSMGNKGCSAEYVPGDGSSAEWETGPVPTAAAEPLPMSCEWLDGDNCWKRFVARAETCKGLVDAGGSFNEDRDACTYDSDGYLEFAGPLSTPSKESVLFPAVDWRIVDDEGEACMTGKILGVGKTLLDIDGEVVYFENKSLTEYEITCSDGTTYSNVKEGVCADFGARWLAHTVPGVLLACDGAEENCELSLWGGEEGEDLITRCAF
jgi:hypothetical protein